jgi:exoribonuclease R
MNNSNFTSYVEYIRDSRGVIAYLMILMNYISAQEFLKYKTGIFRSMKINNNIDVPKYLPNDIGSFLKLWKSNSSKYVSFESEKTHDMLKLNEYIHITSPIRRLVDTLNMLELQHCLGLMDFTKESYYFHQFWTSIEKLDYINQTMQSIRKVQNECNILTKCILEPEVLGYEYNGYIFDVMNRNDGLYQYIVFISELKMINKFISYHKLEKFSKHTFKLYLFEDKDNLKQKVRYEIQI